MPFTSTSTIVISTWHMSIQEEPNPASSQWMESIVDSNDSEWNSSRTQNQSHTDMNTCCTFDCCVTGSWDFKYREFRYPINTFLFFIFLYPMNKRVSADCSPVVWKVSGLFLLLFMSFLFLLAANLPSRIFQRLSWSLSSSVPSVFSGGAQCFQILQLDGTLDWILTRTAVGG
jgi:hypothetical protein